MSGFQTLPIDWTGAQHSVAHVKNQLSRGDNTAHGVDVDILCMPLPISQAEMTDLRGLAGVSFV